MLWISRTDARGVPVDPRLVEAAYAKIDDLFRFRWSEFQDEARRLELIEAAVHRASRARKRSPVSDPAAYLFRTFSNLLDEEIERERRTLRGNTEFLENLPASRGSCPERDLHEQIHRRQILDAMDEETRWIWTRRLYGYQVQEIAAELNVTPDCLSTRLRRGLQQALGKLSNRR